MPGTLESSKRSCWKCDFRTAFRRDAFVRCLLDATDEADLKAGWQSDAFPPKCSTCPRGLDPPSKREMRDVYLDFCNITERLWLETTSTQVEIDESTITTTHMKLAEDTRSAVENVIDQLGFDGFIHSVVVTGNMASTTEILSNLVDPRDLERRLVEPTSMKGLPQGSTEKQISFMLGSLPSALLLFHHHPTDEFSQGERHIAFNMYSMEYFGYEEELTDRIKLELLQAVTQHLRSAHPNDQKNDLKAQGYRVSISMVQLVRYLLGEGVVHSARYNRNRGLRRIQTHSGLSDMINTMGVYKYYLEQSRGSWRPRVRQMGHYQYYSKVLVAIIETLGKAIDNTDANATLPPIAEGLATADPKLRPMFDALMEVKLRELFRYDVDDVALFVSSVVIPNRKVFQELLRLQRRYRAVLPLLKRVFAAIWNRKQAPGLD